MSHRCHWVGCPVEVSPKLWGCRPHWFALPARLRAKIWRTYVPGQEVRQDPSPAYIEVAMEVRQWILTRQQASIEAG